MKSEQRAPRLQGHHGNLHKMFEVDSRLRYFKPHATKTERTFAEEIAYSLGRGTNSRFINSKFFYDNVGSRIFEEICSTPEYYLTRTEAEILGTIGDDLGTILAGGRRDTRCDNTDACDVRLVELGSGSSTKTRIILDILFGIQEHVEYFPIDISDILEPSSEQLLADYRHLTVTGIIDTYEGGLEFLKGYDNTRNLIMFLGSSYGNTLSPEDGIGFLRNVRSAMKPGDFLLMGLDMVKETGVMEAAYDDAAGVTSRFNLNVLSRMNHELGANFVLDNFEHRAIYNPDKRRMEMHLESLRDQTVTIPKSKLSIRLERGERIHTESSHKYEAWQVCEMLERSGLEHVKSWTDQNDYFTLTLATSC